MPTLPSITSLAIHYLLSPSVRTLGADGLEKFSAAFSLELRRRFPSTTVTVTLARSDTQESTYEVRGKVNADSEFAGSGRDGDLLLWSDSGNATLSAHLATIARGIEDADCDAWDRACDDLT